MTGASIVEQKKEPSQQQQQQQPDLFGQVHPHETDALIARTLAEFSVAIEKDGRQHTNEFLLLFLRSEVFDVPLAVRRYKKYWKQREAVFGPTAEIKLTTPSEHRARASNVFRLLPVRHATGRAIVHFRPAQVDTSFTDYSRQCITRVFWTVLHEALLTTTVQQKGILVLTDVSDFGRHQFDRTVVQNILKGMQGAIPMRLSAHFVCYPPAFLQLILPFVLPLVHQRLRNRIKFQFASTPGQMREQLAAYGLGAEHLPRELGGSLPAAAEEEQEQTPC